ncbi:MAG: hypothetical protein GF317_05100 [Candidatus Lokiarchaeota archaeon]|nr:hypothetical protein [Candidatus Lokiarchaeota archaeon]MBD3199183.1 hypothetical protein [Candidatus Lokiarchaeota archaeon]
MPVIDIEVSEEVSKRMKKYNRVNWNKIIETTIEAHIKKMERMNSISIEKLKLELEENGLNLENLTHESNINLFQKMRDLEWKRTYSTRMS